LEQNIKLISQLWAREYWSIGMSKIPLCGEGHGFIN